MAAYAALVSLVNTLDNVQGHRRFSISLDNNQVQSLREKLDFLLDFIQTTSTHFHGVTMSQEAQLLLETQIASAAFAAEDVIESHIVHHIHAAGSMISLLDLQTLIQDMDSLKEKVIISAKEQTGFIDMQQQQPTHPTSSSTSSSPPKSSRMVGLNDELIRLLDELTGHQSSLQVIPIVGMGGIGKTTLARNAYENLLTVQHFHIRAWVTVSQTYSARDIFSKLLSCESGETDEHELGEQLYKRLIGRRYLIILDDIWSIEAWHSIKRFFPDNSNTSRVVVTTRVLSIATQFGTSPFGLEFLDENKSWELFCENTFPGEGCTRELEELGKKIAKKCKGLPLLIVVIGALLRKSSSLEYWENISENIHSILSSGEEESLDILSLSYNHLSAHLKPCFLYMGTFPDDARIPVSKLIQLWVTEGIVKPSKTQSLEEVAEGYLKDLIDRNLVLDHKKGFDEDVEWCSIHGLLRDLCLKKAHKENFLCETRVGDIRQGMYTGRVYVSNQGLLLKPSYGDEELDTMELAFLARASAIKGHSMSIKFKMLRILNAPYSYYYVDDILKLVNVRHISIHEWVIYKQNYIDLHSSISLLWNLQTLTINNHGCIIVAPREIWEMPQLRHVNVYAIWLPDPPLSNQHDHEFVMRNLQTLSRVLNPTEEVCKRIPNVKTLRVIYDEDHAKRIASYDFGSLQKLESLRCQFNARPRSVYFLQNLTFPISLQELTLQGCFLDWEDLTMIGSLPHLQVLRLGYNSVIGSEWNPVEGQFLRLRFLELAYCDDLISWNVDNSHFPLLEKLHLQVLANLNEIPSGLGEIYTLAEIILYECSESSSISALQILNEQESLGNDGLRVQIHFKSRGELKKFKKMIKQFDSSTSNNLQLGSSKVVRSSSSQGNMIEKVDIHLPESYGLELEEEGWNEDVLDGHLLVGEKGNEGRKEKIIKEANSEVKECISFCSLFPSDYEFTKDMLVWQWIAESLIKLREDEVEEVYSMCFDTLLNLEYVVPSGYDHFLDQTEYKVGDKMITFLQEQLLEPKFQKYLESKQIEVAKVEHLYFSCKDIDSINFGILGECSRLQTLIIHGCYGSKVNYLPSDLFLELKALKILKLSRTNIKELPSSVENLKELRYLDMSETPIKWLPESMCYFSNLETLKLDGCLRLIELPECTSKLINLRHLVLDVVRQLQSMPMGIGNLSKLQTLRAFLVGEDDGSRIGELKNMNSLKGSFRVLNLENVLKKEEAVEAYLCNKHDLKKVELQWSDLQDEKNPNEEEILNSLQPPTGIQELKILFYSGGVLPSWISNPSFSELVSITLYRCRYCSVLPSLGELPALKFLNVIENNEAVEVSSLFCRKQTHLHHAAFPKLKKLLFNLMSKLEQWTGLKTGDFPNLQTLIIEYCPKLIGLAFLSQLSSLLHVEISYCPEILCLPEYGLPPTLESLMIKDCPKLKERCCNEGCEDWSKVAHLPAFYIDNQKVSL